VPRACDNPVTVEHSSRPPLTVLRVALHVAPALAAWAYFAWLIAAWRTERVLEDLWPLQLTVAFVAFMGGIFATRLPASKPWRLLLIFVSLAGALGLVAVGWPIHSH
jgi:hypothetical protein